MSNEGATFNGWTVDTVLGEFRKVSVDADGHPRLDTVSFTSEHGHALLGALVHTADVARWYVEEVEYYAQHPEC